MHRLCCMAEALVAHTDAWHTALVVSYLAARLCLTKLNFQVQSTIRATLMILTGLSLDRAL